MKTRDYIYRHEKENRTIKTHDTVILVGNGATDGGSEVFEQVISELEKHELKSTAGQACAVHSYRYRSVRNALISECVSLTKHEGYLEEYLEDDKKRWREQLNSFQAYRNKIGDSFISAKEKKLISLRENSTVFSHIKENTAGFISLNWDSCLWEKESLKNLVHLHGSAHIANSMILPSELSHDEDIFPIACEVTENAKEFLDYYRGELRKDLVWAHHVGGRWLQNAKHLIVWGVAFNTYDAELMSLLFYWHVNKKKKSVHIINPNDSHVEITKELLKVDSSISCTIN